MAKRTVRETLSLAAAVCAGALVGLCAAQALGALPAKETGACTTHVRPYCPVQQDAFCACAGPLQSDCKWLCIRRP